MSYPPPEGYPPPANPYPAPPPQAPPPQAPPPQAPPPQAPPTLQFPAPPAAPAGYPPSPAQISGTPYVPPEDRRRPAVLVLAIASAVLLVFGGLMLALYVNERGNLNDTKANLRNTRADLTAQVQQQQALVTEQQEKTAAAESRATDLDTQLKTTKTNMTKMTTQRNVLLPCMRRFQDAFDAASFGESQRAINSLRLARTACAKAERVIDSNGG